MFPTAPPRETLRFEGNKLTVSQGTSLQVICYIAGNFEARNSLNLAVTALISQRSLVTVHCYTLTSSILQCCPLRYFGGKQFHCYMSCDLEVTNESAHCWQKNSQGGFRFSLSLLVFPFKYAPSL